MIDAQSAFDDFGKTISTGIQSSINLGDAKTFGTETGDSFLTGLRNQVKGVKNYTDDINTLLGRGLSQESLQAVLAAGSESGAAIARELVQGAQDNITGPNGINDLVAAAKTAADSIGTSAANTFYAAGVSNAQSYLDGVQAAFTAAQTALAAPGLTIADVKGIGAAFDNNILGPSVTPITPIRPEAGYGGPGPGVNITVNAGLVSTPAQIGQDIIQSILHAQRRSGLVFAPAT